MTLQINIAAGAAVNGGAGLGLMSASGNPWSVPDALAHELINRGVARYVIDPVNLSGPLNAAELAAVRGVVSGAWNQGSSIAMGDSLTARYDGVSGANSTGQSTSFLQWGAALLGQRILPFAKGVTGHTTQQMLDRWATDIGTTPRAWVHILGGGNDVSADIASATIIANLNTMIGYARALGARVVIGTLYPFASHTTAARRQALHQVNAWIRSQASEYIRVADYHAAMVDGAGAIRTGVLVADNIHPSARGASIMGRVLASVLSDLPPRPQALAASGYDGDQGVPCGDMAGTGAAAGTGMTGNQPRGWTWSRTGAALAATVSKQARSDNLLGSDLARGVITTSGADYDVLRLERVVAYRRWSSGGTSNSVRRFYVPSTGAQYDVLVDGSFAAGSDPTAGWPTTPGAVFTDGTTTLICITPLVSGSTVRLMAECLIGSVSVGQVQPSINASFLNTAGSVLGSVWSMYHDSANAVAPLAAEASAGLVLGTALYTVPAGFDLESTTASAGPTLRVRLELGVLSSAVATVDWGRVTMRRI